MIYMERDSGLLLAATRARIVKRPFQRFPLLAGKRSALCSLAGSSHLDYSINTLRIYPPIPGRPGSCLVSMFGTIRLIAGAKGGQVFLIVRGVIGLLFVSMERLILLLILEQGRPIFSIVTL